MSPEVPVAVITGHHRVETPEEDDDEGVVDLDEELHPDDVEEPLDVLLQERTASATLEDDEEELEEEEVDGDDRADGPTRIVPRRPTSSSASRASSSCRSAGSPTRTGSSATTAPEVMTPAPPVSPTARPTTARLSWGRLAAALGAGLLTGLCFRPRTSYLGPVVLVVARAPAVGVARRAPASRRAVRLRVRRRVLRRRLAWIRYFGYVAIVPLVVAMAAAIAVVGVLVAAFARRRLASPFLTAAAWVVLEALRGRWPLGGFPWADLGVALHDVPAARALASFGGTLLVSFVIVAVNGLRPRARHRGGRAPALGHRRRRSTGAVIGLVGLLVVCVLADVARYEPTTTGHLRVALLQGDDEQLPLAEQTDQPLTAKHLALAARLHGHYDLIVFPESALDTDPETDPFLREQLTDARSEARLQRARERADPRTRRSGQYRNTNLLYTPDGRLQGIYSKQHLVPFGEYVPWRDAAELHRRAPPDPVRLQGRRLAHHRSTSPGTSSAA